MWCAKSAAQEEGTGTIAGSAGSHMTPYKSDLGVACAIQPWLKHVRLIPGNPLTKTPQA